ncbi:2-methylcitrate dehydratase [Rhizobiaceae bacterium]|nr:2-methylcitrate dehydratase [Rhizobiaceae bacterium]
MTITQTMAAHAANRPRDWSDLAKKRANFMFVDTVAVMVAGRREPATINVFNTLKRWSGRGEAVEFVHGGTMPAPWTAMVNGTSAHALDYDDAFEPALTHAGAVLVPALLALGAERRASGRDLVDALLVSLDVQAALAAAMNLGHYGRGWHTTVTFGVPSAAAGCGRLLGFDAHTMRMAISASTSFATGLKRQFGTQTKPFHAGLAAHNGIMAASLAEAGLEAAGESLEGRGSFGDLLGTPGMPGFGRAAERLAGRAAMDEYGIWIKVYPCCASAHRPIDAVLTLRGDAPVAADEVERIDVHLSEVAKGNLTYDRPSNDMEARFSINHCVAAALVDGAVELRHFSPEQIARPDLQAVWPKVFMHMDPDLPASAPPSPEKEKARVVLRLRNGEVREQTAFFPYGHTRNFVSEEMLARKFDDCVGGHLPAAAADALRERLFHFDAVDDVAEIFGILAG